jgi:N-acetylmuramic acid 6-phosphate etherase
MSTERRNPRSVDIDLFPTERILRIINAEDALVSGAVGAVVPDIWRACAMPARCVSSCGGTVRNAVIGSG